MVRLLLLLLLCAGPAGAGGLCLPGETCDTPGSAPIAGFGAGVTDAAPQPDGAARIHYERRLADLWRSEANGTCLGVYGAWHLTPRRIFADGIEFEILGIAGTPERLLLQARRIWDSEPAFFTMVQGGRNRLGVTGTVDGRTTPYNVALERC